MGQVRLVPSVLRGTHPTLTTNNSVPALINALLSAQNIWYSVDVAAINTEIRVEAPVPLGIYPWLPIISNKRVIVEWFLR